MNRNRAILLSTVLLLLACALISEAPGGRRGAHVGEIFSDSEVTDDLENSSNL